MSQVLQKCDACGKVETPLVDGLCPHCRSRGGPLPRVPNWVSKVRHEERASRPASRWIRPSEFLFLGVTAEVIGFACLLTAQTGRTPVAFIIAIVGGLFAIVGGILVSVGTIRWAIWPLIEKADDSD